MAGFWVVMLPFLFAGIAVGQAMTDAMDEAGVSERLNADWLAATNRSCANHYIKMKKIKETNYEY